MFSFQSSSSEDDTYTYINKGVCDKIPSIFSKIVEWGCKKPVDETFKNFMKRENRITNKQLATLFYGSDLEKLDSNNCEGFDVSFLFKLLPFICEGIEEYDASTLRGNKEKLEYLLMELRDIRNGVMHEPKRASKSGDVTDEVVALSFKVFEVAGKKYSIPHGEIIREMKRFMEEMGKILREDFVDEDVTDWENCQFLLQDGRKTLLAKLSPPENDFVPLQLSSGGKKIKSTQILEHISSETSNFFLIKGDSGAGKSALLNDMNEKVLHMKSYSCNNAFDIPIIILSYDTLFGNLEMYLKDLFTRSNTPDKMYLNKSRPHSGEDIIRALENMKPLILVDGFDGIDVSSRNFLREVVLLIKRNETWKCVITSRFNFSAKLCSFLKQLKITPNVLEIPKISEREDQIQFVRKSTNGGEKASETYARLDLNLQTPSQLSHFARLFRNDAEKVESWSNGIPMMGEIAKDDKNKIMHYLDQKNVKNCKTIANQIFTEIKTISFFCLLQNIRIIKDSLCESLEQNVYDKINTIGVPMEVNDILTAFFTCEMDSSSSVYEFYNDHHLQVLAGMYLMQELFKNKGNVIEIIESSIKHFEEILTLSNYSNEILTKEM